ncbi:MAG TPA: hypothetical protein VFU07_05540 [Candidatus Lumbricidophila sp.]|nr:hypothetical protein [Candidatus Lumbricidophila sp.]
MAKKQHNRTTVEGFRPAANPTQAHWMRELRKSNAAQPHVPAPRKGTRDHRDRKAIQDQNQE